jgi:chromosome segregation ATPase
MSLIPGPSYIPKVLPSSSNSLALSPIQSLFATSDSNMALTVQKTTEYFESFMAKMQDRILILCKEYREVQDQLSRFESQFREKESLHQEEVKALKEKAAAFENHLEAMRLDMAESKRIDDERIHKADQDLAKALEDVHKMDELNQSLKQKIQSIDNLLAAQAQKNKETISSLNTEHNKAVSSLQNQLSEYEKNISELKNALNEAKKQNKNYEGNIERLTNTKNQAQSEIQSQAGKIARANAILKRSNSYNWFYGRISTRIVDDLKATLG